MGEFPPEPPTAKRPACVYCNIPGKLIAERAAADGAQWFECQNPDCVRPTPGPFGWWVAAGMRIPDPDLTEGALRKLRHELAGAVVVLQAAGEDELAKQCRRIVDALDRRVGPPRN